MPEESRASSTESEAFGDAWLEASAREVQRRVERVVTRHAADDTELVLSLALLHQPRGGLSPARQGFLPAVHLPLLVHAGITGDEEPALDLAVASVLLEAGIHAFDPGDDELTSSLAHLPRSLVMLIATRFLGHLAHGVLLELDVEPARKVALLELLGTGLGRMTSAQLHDAKLSASAAPSPDDVEASACQKSGERRALYAALAARLAGASASQLDDYQGYARALGVARQLHADLLDLFGDTPSRDLRAGLRTLPVALALREPGEQQTELLGLLEQARSHDAVRAEICVRVRQAGGLRGTLARKEVYCQRALRLLAAATPQPAAALALTSAVRDVSLAEAPADFCSTPPAPPESSDELAR